MLVPPRERRPLCCAALLAGSIETPYTDRQWLPSMKPMFQSSVARVHTGTVSRGDLCVAVLMPDATLQARVLPLLQPWRVTVCPTVSVFVTDIAKADLGLIFVDLACDSAVRTVAWMLQRPARPLLAVSALSPAAVRSWTGLGGGVPVVWLDELERALPAKVRMLVGETHGEAVLLRVAGSSPIITTAVRRLAAARPPRSVEEWAVLCRTSPGALRYHLSVTLPRVRPKQLLQWSLLLAALRLRTIDGMPWPRVACRLGVHERTLGRTARGLTASALGDLTESEACSKYHSWLDQRI